jgi:hypothetical protein
MKRTLTIVLLLFGMIATAKTGNEGLLELKKKAAYYEIKVKLEAGQISIKQAQTLWKKAIKELNKEREGN